MFDIKSFYEAKDVQDAVQALVNEPDAEVISGGTDVLIRVREGKDAGKALVSIHNMRSISRFPKNCITTRPMTSRSWFTGAPSS